MNNAEASLFRETYIFNACFQTNLLRFAKKKLGRISSTESLEEAEFNGDATINAAKAIDPNSQLAMLCTLFANIKIATNSIKICSHAYTYFQIKREKYGLQISFLCTICKEVVNKKITPETCHSYPMPIIQMMKGYTSKCKCESSLNSWSKTMCKNGSEIICSECKCTCKLKNERLIMDNSTKACSCGRKKNGKDLCYLCRIKKNININITKQADVYPYEFSKCEECKDSKASKYFIIFNSAEDEEWEVKSSKICQNCIREKVYHHECTKCHDDYKSHESESENELCENCSSINSITEFNSKYEWKTCIQCDQCFTNIEESTQSYCLACFIKNSTKLEKIEKPKPSPKKAKEKVKVSKQVQEKDAKPPKKVPAIEPKLSPKKPPTKKSTVENSPIKKKIIKVQDYSSIKEYATKNTKLQFDQCKICKNEYVKVDTNTNGVCILCLLKSLRIKAEQTSYEDRKESQNIDSKQDDKVNDESTAADSKDNSQKGNKDKINAKEDSKKEKNKKLKENSNKEVKENSQKGTKSNIENKTKTKENNKSTNHEDDDTISNEDDDNDTSKNRSKGNEEKKQQNTKTIETQKNNKKVSNEERKTASKIKKPEQDRDNIDGEEIEKEDEHKSKQEDDDQNDNDNSSDDEEEKENKSNQDDGDQRDSDSDEEENENKARKLSLHNGDSSSNNDGEEKDNKAEEIPKRHVDNESDNDKEAEELKDANNDDDDNKSQENRDDDHSEHNSSQHSSSSNNSISRKRSVNSNTSDKEENSKDHDDDSDDAHKVTRAKTTAQKKKVQKKK